MTARHLLRVGLFLSGAITVTAANSFIGSFHSVKTVASTVPGNGDQNPYGRKIPGGLRQCKELSESFAFGECVLSHPIAFTRFLDVLAWGPDPLLSSKHGVMGVEQNLHRGILERNRECDRLAC
jgi:hypothetical protein